MVNFIAELCLIEAIIGILAASLFSLEDFFVKKFPPKERPKPRSIEFYYKKMTNVHLGVDIAVFVLFGLLVLVDESRGQVLGWICFLQPIYLIARFAVSGGIYGPRKRNPKGTPSREGIMVLIASVEIFLVFYYSQLYKIEGSGIKLQYELIVIVACFVLGEICRLVIFRDHVESRDKGDYFLNVAIFAAVACVLIKASSFGACVSLVASEPTYQEVQVTSLYSKTSGGRKSKHTTYYADVVNDKGYESTYAVRYKTSLGLEKSRRAKVKSYRSLMGVKVKRLLLDNDM